jgi:hypothetical protein
VVHCSRPCNSCKKGFWWRLSPISLYSLSTSYNLFNRHSSPSLHYDGVVNVTHKEEVLSAVQQEVGKEHGDLGLTDGGGGRRTRVLTWTHRCLHPAYQYQITDEVEALQMAGIHLSSSRAGSRSNLSFFQECTMAHISLKPSKIKFIQ